ncbi:DUF4230 domain-containing protein [Flavisolibacter sp. BT320]|nr:DUF4230 domain-containing protein [Flavisolibacter longurius]
MKWLRNILLIFLLAVVAWWLLGKMEIFPSIRNLFTPKEVVIDQTPVVIRQIKPLAQLATITAYAEVAADTTVRTTVGERLRDVINPFSGRVAMDRQLIVVGKVVIHAGVNLEKLTPQDVFISGDSVSINLPAAEILDVIVNPSGTDIFLEEGEWSNTAVVALKEKIRQKAEAEVKANGILFQADERARDVLLNFFRAAGFTKITITKARLG